MSFDKPRIDFKDSMLDMLQKMTEGNPGALNVLLDSMHKGPAIDPQSALGELSVPLALDGLSIYGPDIWKLYKGVCGQDLLLMIALLRAVQLGLIPERELKDAVRAQAPLAGERSKDVLAIVKSRLVQFGGES